MRHEFIYRGFPRTIAAFASAQIERDSEDMRFEWGETLSGIRTNALLFLDEDRAWWHYCMDDVVSLIEKHRPAKLVGSSMGGYGALLFGGILGLPAIAFGPQTDLNDQEDKRYEKWLIQVRDQTPYPELLSLDFSGDDLSIVYCSGNKADRRHAERMAVRLIPLSCQSHQPAREIANLGAML